MAYQGPDNRFVLRGLEITPVTVVTNSQGLGRPADQSSATISAVLPISALSYSPFYA